MPTFALLFTDWSRTLYFIICLFTFCFVPGSFIISLALYLVDEDDDDDEDEDGLRGWKEPKLL